METKTAKGDELNNDIGLEKETRKGPHDDGSEEAQLPDSEMTEKRVPKEQEAEIESARKEFQKELLYAKAEFDNTKKRLLREQDQAIKFANEKLISEVLNPLDLLDRAIAAAKPLKGKSSDPEVANFITGVEMTYREFNQLLARFGVEFIGQPGEKFDPGRHEAISQQETTEDKKDTVIEVLQKGAALQGRLIKPARVVVGRVKASANG